MDWPATLKIMFRDFFRTVRPLQSEKVKTILSDQGTKNRFLHAIHKVRSGKESASFKNGKNHYRLKLVKDLSLNNDQNNR